MQSNMLAVSCWQTICISCRRANNVDLFLLPPLWFLQNFSFLLGGIAAGKYIADCWLLIDGVFTRKMADCHVLLLLLLFIVGALVCCDVALINFIPLLPERQWELVCHVHHICSSIWCYVALELVECWIASCPKCPSPVRSFLDLIELIFLCFLFAHDFSKIENLTQECVGISVSYLQQQSICWCHYIVQCSHHHIITSIASPKMALWFWSWIGNELEIDAHSVSLMELGLFKSYSSPEKLPKEFGCITSGIHIFLDHHWFCGKLVLIFCVHPYVYTSIESSLSMLLNGFVILTIIWMIVCVRVSP